MDGWADQIAPNLRVETTEEWRAERAEAERLRKIARENERKSRLAEYTMGELWEELHRRMTYENRRWWSDQGVPEDWQEYLKLGFTPDKPYRSSDDEILHSPAFTIPFFHPGPTAPEFCTLQYRLSNPANPADRYRFAPGLGTTWYDTTPDRPVQDKAIICEGAKKAMVVRIHARLGEGWTVLAVPSKSDIYSVIGAVGDCTEVVVWLDPDAPVQARKLAGRIKTPKRRIRVLDCPTKADDAILRYGLDPQGVARLLRDARPV